MLLRFSAVMAPGSLCPVNVTVQTVCSTHSAEYKHSILYQIRPTDLKPMLHYYLNAAALHVHFFSACWY